MNSERLFNGIAVLFITFLAIYTYSNSVDVPFIFDDYPALLENSSIKDISDVKAIISWVPSRALSMYTFALNYHFSHFNVRSYHYVNILIHILNGFLIYLLLLKLNETIALRKINKKITESTALIFPWIALFGASIFVVHPIQTQAVTYIWQRVTILAGLFYLSSLFFHLAALLRWSSGKPYLFVQLLSYSSCLIGYFCKQITFTIPLMVIMIENLFWGKGLYRHKERVWIVCGWLLLLPIIPIIILAFGDLALVHIQNLSDKRLTSVQYFWTQLNVIATYLRLIVLPIDQNLDYDYPIYHNLFNFNTIIAGLIHITLIVLGVKLTQRRPGISLGIFFFYLALSVESSFVPLEDVIFEHRLYLPLAGAIIVLFFIMADTGYIVHSLNMLRGGRRLYPLLVIMLLVFPLARLTIHRNWIWQSEERLWEDVVEKAPKKVRGYICLGKAYLDAGKYNLALEVSQKGMILNPNHVGILINMGTALANLGQIEEARNHYLRALELDPKNELALTGLGIYSARKGEWNLAEKYLRKAAPSAKRNEILGKILIDAKKPIEAKQVLESTFDLPNVQYETLYQISELFVELNETQLALQALYKAMNIAENSSSPEKVKEIINDRIIQFKKSVGR